jgi:hypothetical protein
MIKKNMGTRITDSRNVYLEDQLVGRIIIEDKKAFFKQELNLYMDSIELKKISKMMDEKFHKKY